jgi:hydrogenase expression/formation protein HypE
MKHDKILMAHGGGGQLTDSLIHDHILSRLGNEALSPLGDSALLSVGREKICFSTDSFVVKPLFFNGGDIGTLAVCGTVNDLAVAGARPVALSLALIMEEGLDMAELDRVLDSVAATARACGVSVVTGDTKTVEKGSADKLFINTAGIGLYPSGLSLGMDQIKAGDRILISGTMGDHGMTIMSEREDIKFESPLASDCAPLNGLIRTLLDQCPGIRFMRDPTRGGVAATLNEIVRATGMNVEIREDALPVTPTVQAAADMLGFDVLNIANEGKVVIVVDQAEADTCLKACQHHELGRHADIIGDVVAADQTAVVALITKIGGKRIVQMPYGRELPRIC